MADTSVLRLDPAFPAENQQARFFEVINGLEGGGFWQNDLARGNRLRTHCFWE